MSRIGNKVVIIPEGVSVNLEGSLLTVKGPKGPNNGPPSRSAL